MGRVNYINLVEQVYRGNPLIEEHQIQQIIQWVFHHEVSFETIQVWKARLRKKGIAIPDRRKKDV